MKPTKTISTIKSYPSPTSDLVNLTIPNEKIVKATLFDNNGRNLGVYFSNSISISQMLAGHYILRVETEDAVTNVSIIKQ
ncbi:MAG: hypothetical protein ACJAZ3_001655 [Sphingobacteriales bacterium]